MRIAFLTHQFPGARMGGLGSYTLFAARALAAANHSVHIYTFPLPEEVAARMNNAPDNKITLRIVPDLASRVASNTVPSILASAIQSGGESVYRLAMGALLADALLADHATAPFDIVEAPECEGLAVPLMLSLRQMNSPLANVSMTQHSALSTQHSPSLAVITHIHSGAAISRRGNKQPDTPLDLAIDALEAAAILLADGLLAMTKAVVQETHKALHLTREATIIPLAISADPTFTPPPIDGPVLFVGRLERLKGVDTLIQAATQFLTNCPTARLRFVGPDTPTAPITNESDTRSMQAWMLNQLPPALAPRIEFTGELPPDAVTNEIRNAKFLALPSVVENFSLVAAQALALGRTAIFTANIGTAEMYADTGITFPKGNANALSQEMTTLFQNPDRIHQLSQAAHTRAAQHFSPKIILEKQLAFYQQTITSAAHSRPTLSALPPHLATSLLDPLLALTRYNCGLTSSNPSALTPGQRLLQLMNHIAKENHQPHAQILLYGAGRHTTRLLTEQHLWLSAGHSILAIIDDAPRYQSGGSLLNLPVLSRHMALTQFQNAPTKPPLILSTDTFTHQFLQQTQPLRARGHKVFDLYQAQ